MMRGLKKLGILNRFLEIIGRKKLVSTTSIDLNTFIVSYLLSSHVPYVFRMEIEILRRRGRCSLLVHHVLERCIEDARHDIQYIVSKCFFQMPTLTINESRALLFIWLSVRWTEPHVGLRIHLIKGFAPPSNLFKSIITCIDFSRGLYSSSSPRS